MMKENWVYRRGDIYCADLDPVVGSEQGGIRPVIVIQNDTGNRYSPTLIVATVTTKIRKKENMPTHLLIRDNPAFKEASVVQLEQIRTIDKRRIDNYLGKVTPREMVAIEKALSVSLAMEQLKKRSTKQTVITETDDGNGNIVQTETTVTRTYLYITVSHKTVDEMAAQYGFNQEQKDYLIELLQDKNNSLWSSVLYGITASDDQIVTVALSQIGNVGGEPYWSWYGFGSRVEWCACFVSWCANECGYIDTGVIPKYAGCVNGVQWFKDRGQWMDGSAEPVPGMIIFFDWDNKGSSGPQDGLSDHVGIVQKVENGIVYTVEGNSGDSCRVNQYPVGHYEILGYGIPQY